MALKCTLSATATTDNSESTNGTKDMSEISPQSSSWKLEGDYFEGCNSKSVYPSIFKEDPDERYCNVTAIIIESGFSISYK